MRHYEYNNGMAKPAVPAMSVGALPVLAVMRWAKRPEERSSSIAAGITATQGPEEK